MRRRAPLLLLLALAGCNSADSRYGDPRCFSEDAVNASCTSSEGARYRVVDRDDTIRIGPVEARLTALRAAPTLRDGRREATAERGTFVIATLRVRNLSSSPLDLLRGGEGFSLLEREGDIFLPDLEAERLVPDSFSRGRTPGPGGEAVQRRIVFDVPQAAFQRTRDFPAYLAVNLPPDRCPGRVQCFGYFRLWK